MTSPTEEIEEIKEKTVREQVALYRQLREQLIREIKKYRSEGNERLAEIISESLNE